MARKKKHEEHENHERWLVSYADFITLLFAFFVVMYSVSSVNEGKYRVLSDAIVAAFQQSQRSLKPIQVGKAARSPQSANLEFRDTANPIKVPEGPLRMPSRASKVEGNSDEDEVEFSEFPMAEARMTREGDGSDNEKSELQGMSEAQLNTLANEIAAAMQPLIDRDLISIKRNKRWIEVEINTSILFSSGSALMQEHSLPILEALSHILAAFPNDLRVEGFTDNLPIKSQVFPSNWELSAARAASVVRLFSAEGVAPERMAAIGYGEFRPLASNDTPQGRIKNRRVVVVVAASRHMKRPNPEIKKEPLPPPDTDSFPAIDKSIYDETPIIQPPLSVDVDVEVSSNEALIIDRPVMDEQAAVNESARIKTVSHDDARRLEALIESSGLHRKKSFELDEPLPQSSISEVQVIDNPVSMPAFLIPPPIKLRAPISVSSKKQDERDSALMAPSAGGQ